MTELELWYGIVSKAVACLIILVMMALALYLIWCWYKCQLAKEAAKVQKSRWQARQTDIAFKHLEQDKADLYAASLKKMQKEIDGLKLENRQLKSRIDQLTKAKVVVDG